MSLMKTSISVSPAKLKRTESTKLVEISKEANSIAMQSLDNFKVQPFLMEESWNFDTDKSSHWGGGYNAQNEIRRIMKDLKKGDLTKSQLVKANEILADNQAQLKPTEQLDFLSVLERQCFAKNKNHTSSSMYLMLAIMEKLTRGDAMDCVKKLLGMGISSQFLILLEMDDERILEQVLLIVTNICNSSQELRDAQYSKELFERIKIILNNEIISFPHGLEHDGTNLMTAACSALASICKYDDEKTIKVVTSLWTKWSHLLSYSNNVIVVNSLRCLIHAMQTILNNNEEEPFNVIIIDKMVNDQSLVRMLVRLLNGNKDESLLSTIIISTVIFVDIRNLVVFVKAGMMTKIRNLMKNANDFVQEKALYIISQLVTCGDKQIHYFVENHLFKPIIDFLYFGSATAQSQVIHMLDVVCKKGNVTQLLYIMNLDKWEVDMDLFQAMAGLLNSKSTENVVILLTIFQKLLKVASEKDLLDKAMARMEESIAIEEIIKLKNDKNCHIVEVAVNLESTYFKKK